MKGNDIRRGFLKFFEDNGHKIISSSPLVPIDDDTLLFANAGMNQFKNIFLGRESRDYKRASTCQKVVRAGGKHNDLENVGVTARHHTFFEMLGNFSFGDYFKVEAIKFAWTFLTEELKLDQSKLLVTIYKDDNEAFDIWHNTIGLSNDKIFRKGEKDNFWQMGDIGPCGPCSEIFYDQGSSVGCKRNECDIDCECDRHLEIWNLVFMQFNRDEKGNLLPLPKPSIDTGMGLERVATILQNVSSNYDTDLIRPIIDFISTEIDIPYGNDELKDISMRVIADHSRATTFLIADGVIPSNEGRGYVLRRIMRRAMRHIKLLGFDDLFFYKVSVFIIDFMKEYYTELADKRDYIQDIVEREERSFSKTLSSGLEIFYNEILPKQGSSNIISGDDIFKLYDTFGFPVDLLNDIAKDNNLILDMDRFNECMATQQDQARSGGLGVKANRTSDTLVRLGSTYTSKFLGYRESADKFKSKVVSIIKDDIEVDIIGSSDKASIILDNTIFYPEGGGQVGDLGSITTLSGEFIVEDTFKVGDAIIHRGYLAKGELRVSNEVDLHLDIARRGLIESSHTATHLLHRALQLVLGNTVRQAGSYVDERSLRFDYTFSRGMTEEEISEIEILVTKQIFDSSVIMKTFMSKDEAVKLGAMALFGERYGDEVRVVSIGDYSLELCGGCHIDKTSEIGLFKIISEQSIASGVRRIEALTSYNALEYLNSAERLRRDISKRFKVSNDEIIKRLDDMVGELKLKDKQIKVLEEQLASLKVEDLLSELKVVNDINVISLRLDNNSIDQMRLFLDKTKQQIKSGVVIVTGINNGKGILLVGTTKDISSKLGANEIIKRSIAITGGRGGGKSDFAQAGIDDISKLDKLTNSLVDIIYYT